MQRDLSVDNSDGFKALRHLCFEPKCFAIEEELSIQSPPNVDGLSKAVLLPFKHYQSCGEALLLEGLVHVCCLIRGDHLILCALCVHSTLLNTKIKSDSRFG